MSKPLAAPPATGPVAVLKKIVSINEMSSVLMLLAAVIVFASLSPHFLRPHNIRVILEGLPELGILAAGVTMLMITREFDLSVGSVFALGPIILLELLGLGWSLTAATGGTLVFCAFVGAIHAVVTLRLRIPSFITTLGGMMLWRGVALLITEGFPPAFPAKAMPLRSLLVTEIGIFRYSFFYFLAVVVILWLVLERTRFGNWMYGTGGHEAAARTQGINTMKVKFANFVLVSFLAGFAGIVQAVRLRAVLPSAGQGYELDAIAAAVIGGAQLSGGVGSVIGGALGALLIRIIDNGLVLAGAPSYWFRVFIALVLVLAVVLNTSIREKVQRMR